MTNLPAKQEAAPIAMLAVLEKALPKNPTLATRVMRFAEALEVRLGSVLTAHDAETLTAEVEALRAFRSECEDEKKAITTPLTRIVRAWGERWNPAIKKLEAVERAAKAAVIAFQEAQEETAKAKLEAALTAENPRDEIAAVVQATTTRPMSSRTDWKFYVMHKSRIPERFKIVDIKALNAEAAEHNEATDIPGGFAYCETVAVMRRKKG